MTIFHNRSPIPDSPITTEMRRRGRVRCDMLQSSMGEVTDISASGMRVLHKGSFHTACGKFLSTKLSCPTAQIQVMVRVCWFTKTGFRRHIVGLEFLKVDKATEKTLLEMLRFGILRCVGDYVH